MFTTRKLALLSLPLTAIVALSACASSTQSTRTTLGEVETVTEEYSNIHILRSGEDLILVDSGLESTAAEADASIRSLGLDPSRVKAVVLTHGHADHAGGALYFRERYGATIVVGAGDHGLLAAGKSDHLCPTGDIAKGRLEEDIAVTFTPFEADLEVDEEQTLGALVEGLVEPVAGCRVVPVAGHTEGTIALICGDAAFVGDIFRGAIVGSSAETHFYMCDLEDNRRDIEALLADNPKVATFFPGHFGPVARAEVEAYVEEMRAEGAEQNTKASAGPRVPHASLSHAP